VRELDKTRVMDLMRHLQRLDQEPPAPEGESIRQVARQAIFDEIGRLVQRDWLAVYRNGDLLDVVSLT
jgi:hypothetical protein